MTVLSTIGYVLLLLGFVAVLVVLFAGYRRAKIEGRSALRTAPRGFWPAAAVTVVGFVLSLL